MTSTRHSLDKTLRFLFVFSPFVFPSTVCVETFPRLSSNQLAQLSLFITYLWYPQSLFLRQLRIHILAKLLSEAHFKQKFGCELSFVIYSPYTLGFEPHANQSFFFCYIRYRRGSGTFSFITEINATDIKPDQ